jgi:hypothetical protein
MDKKQQAVELMCKAIDDMNREMASKNNMSPEQIEQWIVSQKEQMIYVNSMLYDTLVYNGFITQL